MHPAAVVDEIERGLDAELHLDPKLFGRAGERCRDSKPNLVIGHPADGRGAFGYLANRRNASCILVDGSRVGRRNFRACGGRTLRFRGIKGLACKPRHGRRLTCARAKHLVKFRRKFAGDEQRDCCAYGCRRDGEATQGGEPTSTPWSWPRLSCELRIPQAR